MKELIRMNQLAGLITEGQARKMLAVLNEVNFLDKMKELNPGYSKEGTLADFADEYEKPEDWEDTNIDVSDDYEEHQEYLKDAEEWFKKMESSGPTVKVGDMVKVYMRSLNKEGIGKIVAETVMKGKYGFAGSVEPQNIPSWKIDSYDTRNIGVKKSIDYNGTKYYFVGTLQYPQYEEGMEYKFSPLS